MDDQHTPHVDETAPAVTRQQRVIAAAPDRVFGLLADVASWPRWQPAVTRVVTHGQTALGSTFRWTSGVSITSTVTVFRPGEALAWTGRAIGTRAVHTWTLEPVEGGTLVTTEESMDGWLPRLMTGMVRRTLDQGVRDVLDALEEAAR